MPSNRATSRSTLDRQRSELEVQAVVMGMADEYTIALSEAMRPIIQSEGSGPVARQLAQGFQRNGTASAIDIAVGPNPDAALLDLLVLVSLQRWAFGAHWIPGGITDEPVRTAGERLRLAEESAWRSASAILSEEQRATLRSLIDEWIGSNPDRFMVSFVRFGEFVDIRKDQTLARHAAAEGLLRDISQASAAVDSARLLGERALWYAGRYPLVLGQTAELTMYRVADQPEFRSALASLASLGELKEAVGTLSAKIDALDDMLSAQQDATFTRLAGERAVVIEEARAAIDGVARSALEEFETKFAAAREAAVIQTFDRLAVERGKFFDELESREGALRGLLSEFRGAIGPSTELAKELTGTVSAIDRVVARFDGGSGPGAGPGGAALDIGDVRDAAAAATQAAEKLTDLLERTNELAGSAVWDERLSRLDRSTSGMIDRAFWRALFLVLVFIGGLALVRLLPQRMKGSASARPA